MLLIAIAIIVGIGFAFRNTKGDEPEADMDYGKAVELTLKFLDIQKGKKKKIESIFFIEQLDENFTIFEFQRENWWTIR